MIEKKIRGTFFFYAENLDFGSIWATLNHLLQQGKFWFCARISHFLHDFTTYSTDKHKLDQRFKFLHQIKILRKVYLRDSNDHYIWHLVIRCISNTQRANHEMLSHIKMSKEYLLFDLRKVIVICVNYVTALQKVGPQPGSGTA